MTIKSTCGYLLSCYLNARLSRNLDRNELARIVDLANRHPNWLADVTTDIRVKTSFGFDMRVGRESCEILEKAA